MTVRPVRLDDTTGLLTAAAVAYVDVQAGLDTKVDKSATANIVYVNDGSGVSTVLARSGSATANTLTVRDTNANILADNFVEGFATTATAAGTTTLTVDSKHIQQFTGSTTQTVLMPTTSVPAGFSILVINSSSGSVTVQSSGANTISGGTLTAGTSGKFVALVATPTTAAHWFKLT